MTEPPGEVIDLDYDSPLESLFSFGSSGLFLGAVAWCTLTVARGSKTPAFPGFHLPSFLAFLLMVWLLSKWIRRNIDVRYQIDAATQQLLLVRKIFFLQFKTACANLTDLQGLAWSGEFMGQKGRGKVWGYALFLVKRNAGLVRVSNYFENVLGGAAEAEREDKAAEIAQKLGLEYSPLVPECGRLQASLDRDGKVVFSHQEGFDQSFKSCLPLVLFLAFCAALGYLFSL